MARCEGRNDRFLLFGGHVLFRETLRISLARFGIHLVPVASIEEAFAELERASRGGPEEEISGALVDDDGLEGGAPLAAVSALLGHAPALKIALLSANRSPALPAEAIRAGASAFLLKDMPLTELRYALQRMADGQLVVDPVVTRSLLAFLDHGSEANGNGNVNGSRPQLRLTEVERKVLRLAAEGRPNKRIAAELHLSPLTVKNHLARIRSRLRAADRTQAVAIALRNGLLD